jgi:hypothetical protein
MREEKSGQEDGTLCYYNILCQVLVQVQSTLKWVHMGSKVDVVNMVMGF